MPDFSTPFSEEVLAEILGEDLLPHGGRREAFAESITGEFLRLDDRDFRFDQKYGLSASFERLQPRTSTSFGELSLPVRVIEGVVEALEVSADDTVIDVGSGRGRLALLLHELTGARVHGIEIEQSYVDFARSKTPPEFRKHVSFAQGDAATSELGEPTIVCLINPFRGEQLEQFLGNLRKAALTVTHPIQVMAHGMCAIELFQCPWLQRVNDSDGLESVALFAATQ